MNNIPTIYGTVNFPGGTRHLIFNLFFPIMFRGRPRSVSREEPVVEAQEDDEEEEEDEARIPGMPSKPCPQCDERFTTREGFLEHIVVHSSIISCCL